jgi:hypothetical protein
MQSSPHVLLAAAGFAVWCRPALAMAALPPWLLLAILGLVWISDTAAYFVGRAVRPAQAGAEREPRQDDRGRARRDSREPCLRCYPRADDAGHRRTCKWARLGGVRGRGDALCVCGILGDLFESRAKRYAGSRTAASSFPGTAACSIASTAYVPRCPSARCSVAWAGTSMSAQHHAARRHRLDRSEHARCRLRHPDRYRVFALSARNSVEPLLELCRRIRRGIAVLSGVAEDRSLRRALRICAVASCASARRAGGGRLAPGLRQRDGRNRRRRRAAPLHRAARSASACCSPTRKRW